MTPDELDQLWESNMDMLNQMSIGAGSMVKVLLKALEDTQVYLQLQQPAEHSIQYELVEGDMDEVLDIADQLGLDVTDDTITVPS